jgi:peptide/nickel transport system substrate-binding protein/microcin C transport system substrate-binding protein
VAQFRLKSLIITTGCLKLGRQNEGEQLMIRIISVALSLAMASASISALAVGNPQAPQGGNINFNIKTEPPTIHPISATDVSAQNVHDYTLSSLLTKDIETYEWKPLMAEKWEISKDGKVFTFWLRKNLTFHDGHPLTAEDVKFSFDAIFEPKYNAAHKRPYYEGISKVEVVDPYTVKFYTKDLYFLNFDIAAGMSIIPKHIYSDVEKSKKMTKELIGSGPYKIEKFDKGQKIVLKKYDKWFGNGLPEFKGMYNPETVTLRFVKDENVYLEMMNKGDLDYIDLSPEQYVKKTDGGNWGKTALKFKVENRTGKGYRYVGWNLENPIFKDKDIRVALAHLMNREEMIKKFRYDLSVPATGPTDVFSDYASPNVKAIGFDPKKAQELLAKAGWKDSDKDGVLDKMVNGKKVDFRFSLIHSNKEYEKYLTYYKEDLKKAGIDMEIKYLEWNSFLKLLDEGKFDAVSLAWSTGIEFDPKQQWHSSSAVPGGSNFIHYKVPEVDKLIDQARAELDRKKRIPLLRKVYERIANDAPYVFMFNEKYDLYANSSKVGKPADTFKYGIGSDYWWIKP